MHTETGSTFVNHVTLTFSVLTLQSVHAKRLPYAVFLPTLVLIAQAFFLLECKHTDTHTVTDTTERPTHGSASAGLGN